MFENIETFRIASGLARHASERQAVIARNIANADTPGYRAGDIGDFASQFNNSTLSTGGMRATRPEHLTGTKIIGLWDRVDAPDETSPNGNTVSLEGQMVKSAAASSQHDLAMTLYRSSINLMRAAIGKAR